MGCDIHPYFEVLHNGEWVLIGRPVSGRNYGVFARLSDVRVNEVGQNPLLITHQPDDWGTGGYGEIVSSLSPHTRGALEEWGLDAHSLTIIDYDLLKDVVEDDGYFIETFVISWLKMMEPFTKHFENVRVVMWYDN